MNTGTIHTYKDDRGFGFIQPSGGGEDVFFHVSDVESPERMIKEGASVRFGSTQGKKGPEATRVLIQTGDGGDGASSSSASSRSPRFGAEEAQPLRVPRDAAPYLTQRRKIDNLALAIHKAVRFEEADEGGYEPERIPDLSVRFPGALMDRVQSQYDALVQSQSDLTTRSFRRSVEWRLAVGLGQASVYETNITLHHVYGVPYIPGSGVKGAVRSFILQEVFYDGQVENLEERGLADPLFCHLFGNPADSTFDDARKGCITFFDAYPSDPPTVERDIMNPHYREYYMNQEPPTDDQDPTPINFLTVRDTSFAFWLGDDGRGTVPEDTDSALAEATPKTARGSLLEVASHWLDRTLTEHGVGAKTATGYGFFTE